MSSKNDHSIPNPKTHRDPEAADPGEAVMSRHLCVARELTGDSNEEAIAHVVSDFPDFSDLRESLGCQAL